MKSTYEEDPYVDKFAQTRQPDDLFNDDYTPIAEPITQVIPPIAPRSSHPQPRGRGNPTRGRGRGYPRANDNPYSTNIAPKNPPPPASISIENTAVPSNDPSDPPKTAGASAVSAVTGPQTTTPPVRGSRLQTGGVQKPKLTEDELSARLAAARLNNAKREEAHRLAEADEASFQRREAQAKEKRREEGLARRVMEGEREKNRLRKLGARGGREWDEGKEEVQEKARGARRGVHGGVVGGVSGRARGRASAGGGIDEGGKDEDRSRSAERGSFEGRRGRGRGRGDRGRGRGRGRGDLGDFGGDGVEDATAKRKDNKKLAAFVETDFPTLMGNVTKKSEGGKNEKIATLSTKDILKSLTGDRGTWADQVEAGAAAGAS